MFLFANNKHLLLALAFVFLNRAALNTISTLFILFFLVQLIIFNTYTVAKCVFNDMSLYFYVVYICQHILRCDGMYVM